MLLAEIGANSTVVVSGLLHDTIDDSFMSYDDIFGTFGAGVADLVEGVRGILRIQIFDTICFSKLIVILVCYSSKAFFLKNLSWNIYKHGYCC